MLPFRSLSIGNIPMKKSILIMALIACIIATGCIKTSLPKMEIHPLQLSFDRGKNIDSFQIFNNGSGFLKWKITEIPKWMNASLLSGTLSPHEKVNVSIKVDVIGLINGDYKEYLKIESNGGKKTIII